MFMSRFRILAALIAASAAMPVAAAEPAPAATEETAEESAVAFARSLIDEATTTLTDETLWEDERLQKFRGFLGDKMDLDFISRIVLASRWRNDMSDDQRARYDAAFPKYMTRIYADQFNKIFGKPYKVTGSHPASRGDFYVATEFNIGDNKTLDVIWRIRGKNGENKIVDINVQGGSIITMKREEFSSFVGANGVEALLDRLEEDAQSDS